MTAAIANYRRLTVTRGGVTVQFGPITFRLFTALIACGVFLPSEDIKEHLWGDREDGGPLAMLGVIRAHVSNNQHRLKSLGYEISNTYGRGYELHERKT